MARRMETRMHECMRNLLAQGWDEEALIVDTAAQLAGGDEAAKLMAQRVYDRNFKLYGAV